MLIDVVQETAQVLVGRMEVGVVMEPDFLFLHGAHEALGRAIFRRLADVGHADLDPERLQRLGIDGRGVRDPLVGVVHLGPMLHQGPLSGGHGQRLIPVAAQMPAADAARIDIPQHRQGDERLR